MYNPLLALHVAAMHPDSMPPTQNQQEYMCRRGLVGIGVVMNMDPTGM